MKNEDFRVPNFHAFLATTHGATETLPARMRIESLRFRETIWISRGDNNHWEEDAVQKLQSLGYNVIGQSEYSGKGFVFFSDTFKPLKPE
jgi:hypothetical protein